MAEPEEGPREKAKSKVAADIEPEPDLEPEPPPKKEEEDVTVPETKTPNQEEEDDEMEGEGGRVDHKSALAAVVTEKDLVHQENSLLSDHLMVLQNPPDVKNNPVPATEPSLLVIYLSIYHSLSLIGSLLNPV